MLPATPFRIARMLAGGIAIFGGIALSQLPSARATHGTMLPGNVYVYGKVVLDDGTPAPDSVPLERVCNGIVRREAYTDSKGRFSFEIGREPPALQDGSTSSTTGGPTGQTGAGGPVVTSNVGVHNVAGGLGSMADCELRAVLPGFVSDVISLAGRRSSNTPDLGSIILHRLSNVSGTVISKTSLEAPPDARKAYEKGLEALRKNKPRKAQELMEQAVALYPKHAAAWYELGRLQERAGNFQQASQTYARAVAADSKFVSSYLPLAQLAARDQDWQRAAATTDQLIRLDPVDYPQAYYYNALAKFRLSNLTEAARSAREAKKLDTAHAFPKIDHVLGMILAEQHDYPGAAAALRSYLQFAAEDHDAATARMQLAAVERINGTALGITAHLAPAIAGSRVTIHIPADHITLTPRDGQWTGQLLLAIAFDDSSQPPLAKSILVPLQFTPQVRERVNAVGLTLNRNVNIPAGASFMRVDVRDVPSGAVGTLTLDLAATAR
jgi:tetratricopeptide (TPR) repeat protein